MNGVVATWIDGVQRDSLPVVDRAVSYGDGLFETILVRRRTPRFLALHLERLATGCRRLGIPLPFDEALRGELAVAAALAPPLAILKLLVTRGSALRRGYAPDGNETPRRVVSLSTSELPAGAEQGVDLHVCTIIAADQPALAGIKHLNRLENVLAAREAREAGAFDALMLAADRRIVSGAMSNLFIVSAGRLYTPPVDRAGVAGVMRGVVLRECSTLGIESSQRDFTIEELRRADEVFITNARIGVVPVRRVGEHGFPMNSPMDSLTRRIAAHVEALDA